MQAAPNTCSAVCLARWALPPRHAAARLLDIEQGNLHAPAHGWEESGQVLSSRHPSAPLPWCSHPVQAGHFGDGLGHDLLRLGRLGANISPRGGDELTDLGHCFGRRLATGRLHPHLRQGKSHFAERTRGCAMPSTTAAPCKLCLSGSAFALVDAANKSESGFHQPSILRELLMGPR